MMDSKERVTVGVRLEGTREELRAELAKLKIEVRPWRPDGGWPIPFVDLIGDHLLNKYVSRGKKLERLQGIEGGEVVPHLHHKGDVFVLGREDFKEMVGDVAKTLAEGLVDKLDYDRTVDVVGRLAIDTVPMPEKPK